MIGDVHTWWHRGDKKGDRLVEESEEMDVMDACLCLQDMKNTWASGPLKEWLSKKVLAEMIWPALRQLLQNSDLTRARTSRSQNKNLTNPIYIGIGPFPQTSTQIHEGRLPDGEKNNLKDVWQAPTPQSWCFPIHPEMGGKTQGYGLACPVAVPNPNEEEIRRCLDVSLAERTTPKAR